MRMLLFVFKSPIDKPNKGFVNAAVFFFFLFFNHWTNQIKDLQKLGSCFSFIVHLRQLELICPDCWYILAHSVFRGGSPLWAVDGSPHGAAAKQICPWQHSSGTGGAPDPRTTGELASFFPHVPWSSGTGHSLHLSCFGLSEIWSCCFVSTWAGSQRQHQVLCGSWQDFWIQELTVVWLRYKLCLARWEGHTLSWYLNSLPV